MLDVAGFRAARRAELGELGTQAAADAKAERRAGAARAR